MGRPVLCNTVSPSAQGLGPLVPAVLPTSKPLWHGAHAVRCPPGVEPSVGYSFPQFGSGPGDRVGKVLGHLADGGAEQQLKEHSSCRKVFDLHV